MPTFDIERLTAFSESSPRTKQIDTLQYHHAATTSLDALEYNMEPGGREVSANCALDTDGTLILKVPIDRRAFTSGVASYDHRCITVETVNTSSAPEWGISDAEHRRMGKLAAEMLREGLLQGLFYGTGGIIGHKDVPGTYATACPGPCYDPDLILKYANEYLAPPTRKKKNMPLNIVKKSTFNKADGSVIFGTTEYATLGEPVKPVILYKRNEKDDVAPAFSASYGPHTPVTDKVWDQLLAEYTPAAGSTGSGSTVTTGSTVSLSKEDRALLTSIGNALGTKLDALPGQIDQYADGRKQG